MGGRRPGRGEGGHESGPKGRATAAVWAGIGVINNQDLDGLVALYAPDATMVLPDGSTVTGTEAIREQWAGLLAMEGRMTLRSRYAIESGDLAILSNEWTFTAGDQTVGATTAEVARRQADGGWLYVMDHPYAGLEPEELAALAAAMEG